MSMAFYGTFCVFALLFPLTLLSVKAQLRIDFYEGSCPGALNVIKSVVEQAVQRESRMGASLLRLHFHDCFVNGCDGSILLDDNDGFVGEKSAAPNNNSVRGFEVIDNIKAALNEACYGNVISCADIVAVAARDGVSMLGGPWYEVPLGRRDAKTTSKEATNSIPPPFSDFNTILTDFRNQGLTLEDMVVLSGSHTLGFAQCRTFRNRIYNDTNIDGPFAEMIRQTCPRTGGNENLKSLDSTPDMFKSDYYSNLLYNKGLLHSDQELFKGGNSVSDSLVRYYSGNPDAFAKDFAAAMVKMGNIKVLTGTEGEIRMNCRRRN